MQARYYDPVIGRFYSNDPIGFRDIHSFNRYAYVNNNPYKYTDPTGMYGQLLDESKTQEEPKENQEYPDDFPNESVGNCKYDMICEAVTTGGVYDDEGDKWGWYQCDCEYEDDKFYKTDTFFGPGNGTNLLGVQQDPMTGHNNTAPFSVSLDGDFIGGVKNFFNGVSNDFIKAYRSGNKSFMKNPTDSYKKGYENGNTPKTQKNNLNILGVIILLVIAISPKSVFGLYNWGYSDTVAAYIVISCFLVVLLFEFFRKKTEFIAKSILVIVFLVSLIKCSMFVALVASSSITISFELHGPLLFSFILLIGTGFCLYKFIIVPRLWWFLNLQLCVFLLIHSRLYIDYFHLVN